MRACRWRCGWGGPGRSARGAVAVRVSRAGGVDTYRSIAQAAGRRGSTSVVGRRSRCASGAGPVAPGPADAGCGGSGGGAGEGAGLSRCVAEVVPSLGRSAIVVTCGPVSAYPGRAQAILGGVGKSPHRLVKTILTKRFIALRQVVAPSISAALGHAINTLGCSGRWSIRRPGPRVAL